MAFQISMVKIVSISSKVKFAKAVKQKKNRNFFVLGSLSRDSRTSYEMKFLALFLLDTVFSGRKSHNVKPAADIPRTVKIKSIFLRVRQFDS